MGDGAEAGGQLRDDVLIEWYRYAPGPPVALPKHAHAEYQLNLNVGAAGGVRYRGAHHVTPAGTLAVIMPEEAHTPVDPDERPMVTTHLTLYVATDLLRDVARGLGRSASWPSFRHPVVDDPDLVRRFARLHASLSGSSSALDQDVRLCEVMTDLVDRHARGPAGAHQPPAAHRAVRRARDHLHDNVTANVSLAELARVGGVSPYHLTRLFTDGVGMPPHAYQVQLRLSLAKRLLATGRSVNDTAHETGFFDLSHFTRHFKRHVGIPPGAYARRSAPAPPLG
jgi:AraC-like DNA-binding protein